MTHQIQRLLPRHFKILEMKLAGFSNVEIAKTLDVTPENIYAVSRSPLFQAEYNRQLTENNKNGIQQVHDDFATKAREVLESSAQEAAEKQVELMDSMDESVSLRASNSILDRVLGKPDAKVDSVVPSTLVINAPDSKLLFLALKESQNAKDEPVPNGSSTHTSKDQQGDVCQTPSISPRVGHRKAQAPGDANQALDSIGCEADE